MSRRTRMPRGAGMPPALRGGYSYREDLRAALLPYLATPSACLVAWPLTGIGHACWGGSPWTGAALTAAGGALTALTWRAARPRGALRQRVATATAAGAAVWTLGATIAGPWQSPWLGLWALGTVTASGAMALLRVLAKGGDDGDGGSSGGLGQAVAALRDARIGQAKVTGARVSAPVTMAPGDTIAEVEGARDAIASVLDVPSTAVRVHRDPDSVRRGRLEIVPVDQLRHPIAWAGPSAPGRSVGDAPIRCGRYEDGEPVELWLTGRPGVRPAIHLRATGMTGAGKTEWAKIVWADYLTRSDGALIIVDTVKRDQTVKPVRPGLAALIDTPELAEAFLETLAETVIPARTAALGAQDLGEWMPGCGLSHLLVWIEESASWSDHPSVVDIAERARSAGICLVLSQQRWTHDRAPTSLRAQFGAGICFGIDSRDDPTLALSERTVDAGADPGAWGNSKPGYCYVEAPGIPDELRATPARAELADRDDITTTVTSWARVRKPLDQVTARALAAFLPQPQPVSAGATQRPASRTADQPEDTMPTVRPGVNPADPPDDCDPSQPLEIQRTPRRLSLALPDQMDPERARGVLRLYLARLYDQGAREVRPADLGDVLAETGYGATWLSKALAELTGGTVPLLGRPTRRGVYPLLPRDQARV